MLIGIVGLNGSGKDAVGKYLAARHNFACVDIGQVIRDDLRAMGRDFLDRKEMYNLANERRKEFGLWYWCRRAIEAAGGRDVVITSIRNQGEVEEILSRGGVVVEVFAGEETRFRRTSARVKADPNMHGNIRSFDEFKAAEAAEFRNRDLSKQQLELCIKAAQYRIDNNGTFDQLYEKIEDLLAVLGKRKA
jgi:dephospho-CoA kinase